MISSIFCQCHVKCDSKTYIYKQLVYLKTFVVAWMLTQTVSFSFWDALFTRRLLILAVCLRLKEEEEEIITPPEFLI